MNPHLLCLSLGAALYFDGTTMTIQIQSLLDPTGAPLNDMTGTAARVFEFLRAKGIETQDYRVIVDPKAKSTPWPEPPAKAEPAVEPSFSSTVPIYDPASVGPDHVTYSPAPKDPFNATKEVAPAPSLAPPAKPKPLPAPAPVHEVKL